MNERIVDIFTSQEYKLLYFLKTLQIPTHDNRIIDSQMDIAREFGISVATVNKLIATLRESRCLEKYKRKSGYKITTTGEYVINQIEKINVYFGGKQNG